MRLVWVVLVAIVACRTPEKAEPPAPPPVPRAAPAPAPVAQGISLRAVRWISESEAWAVGTGGLCLKSTDRGASWSEVATTIAGEWVLVERAPDGAVWLAGALGARLRTTDGGKSFTVVAPSRSRPESAPKLGLPPLERDAGPGRLLVRDGEPYLVVSRYVYGSGSGWRAETRLERIDGERLVPAGGAPGRPDAVGILGERFFCGTHSDHIEHPSWVSENEHATVLRNSAELLASVDGEEWTPVASRGDDNLAPRFLLGAGRRAVVIGFEDLCPSAARPQWESRDGGASWQDARGWTLATDEPPERAADACVLSDAEGALRCTWDGGASWYEARYPREPCNELAAADARDLRSALRVSFDGTIRRLEDGRWVERFPP